MKKVSSIMMTTLTALTALAFTGCEQFSTSYERIDADEFRMLKYVWEPTDAAPGDTVTLTAVFAGKRLDLDNDLEWLVSYNVIVDLFGSATVVDTLPLKPRAKSELFEFSRNTQAIRFKIPVPDDIVKKSASIPEAWADMLPRSVRDSLPSEFTSMTKTQMVDMIESYANIVNRSPPILFAPAAKSRAVDAAEPSADVNGEIPQALLLPILQYFTVPMRVTAKIREPGRLPHTITSTQNIRYNNRFKAIGVPVNNIPKVDMVVVYKVKGSDVSSIENKNGLTYDSTIIDNSGNSVIVAEKGYSYFLGVFSGNKDSTTTMDGNRVRERHLIYRQFQLDKEETAGIHHSKFMSVDNNNGKITLPADKRITKFVFWLTVYDEIKNERLRPNGETLIEVSGRLVYK